MNKMITNIIPLFPLNMVVFPKENISLHIFEDRYKKMISNCISSKSEFGIILKNNNIISNIGCTVMVDKLLKTYSTGELDITLNGIERFKILDKFKQDDLLFANISKIDEAYDLVDKNSFSMILDKYLKLLLSFNIKHDIHNEMNKNISFDFTKSVVIPSLIKQEFLELSNESERIDFIDIFLDSVINNSDSNNLFDQSKNLYN
jgi:Lon protease-like protein